MAGNTIAIIRRVFSAFGLTEQVVKENGPQFVSREFADFMESNGINQAHPHCPLPFIIQRGCREVGPNFQASHESG